MDELEDGSDFNNDPGAGVACTGPECLVNGPGVEL